MTVAVPPPVTLPPINIPIIGKDGSVSLAWYRFFQQLGSNSGLAGVATALAGEIATAAAEASTAGAEAAQALALATSVSEDANESEILAYLGAAEAPTAPITDFSAAIPYLTMSLLDAASGGSAAPATGFVSYAAPQSLTTPQELQGLANLGVIPYPAYTLPIETGSGALTDGSGDVIGVTIPTPGGLSPPLADAATVYAGPGSGDNATPTFRGLLASDIPALPYDASGAAATAQSNAETYAASVAGTAQGNAEAYAAALPFVSYAGAQSLTTGQQAQARANINAGTSSTVGTVTSVGLTLPGILSLTGSPVTSAGTLAVTLATQAANLVWAGPSSGAAAAPTFRALVAGDIPALAYDASGAAATAQSNAETYAASQAATAQSNAETYAAALPFVNSSTTHAANLVFAGPSSGAAAAGAFRSLVVADIPSLSSLYDASGAAATAQSNAETYAAGLPFVNSSTTRSANTVFAGPSSGSPAAGSFRALTSADIPQGLTLSSLITSSLVDTTTNVTAGAGLRIRASASAPGILQFTNNAGSAEWATIQSPSTGNITFTDGSGVTLGIVNEAGYISAYGVDATTVTGPGFGVRIRASSSGNAIIQFTDIGVTTQLATLTCTPAGVVGVNGLPILTDQGAWTAYTPTVSATSGTYGSGVVVSGRYLQLGRLVTVNAVVSTPNIGSAGGGVVVSIPVAQRSGSTAIGQGRENNVNGKMLQIVTDGQNAVQVLNYDNSSPIVAGASYLISFTYEAATG